MAIMQHSSQSQEKKILWLSMVVLSLTFVIVYFILYSVKWSNLPASQPNNQSSWNIIIKEKSIGDALEENLALVDEMATWGSLPSVGFTWSLQKTWIASPTIGTSTASITGSLSSRKVFSWTSLYYGEIDFIEKLGISYDYALQDWSWNCFVSLGTELAYDFSNIARKLNGNLYVMNTEQEILKNNLFGEKIIFINIPEYKDKVVLFLAYVNKHIRLIKMNYSLYHSSKPYLQHLFID